MKNRNDNFAVRVLAVAVQGALATMCMASMAHAEDLSVTELSRPDSYVQVGVEGVSQSSAKFGEYNGLKKSEGSLIGDFSVTRGNAFDGSGTTVFQASGHDLGTTSRDFEASYGQQGRWKVRFGYDELKHNLSDTYQTPYQQSMGGNVFTLPAGFGYIDTTKTTSTATGNGLVPGTGGATGTATTWAAGTLAMTAAQQQAFHTEELSSTRKNTSFGADFEFDHHWSVKLDYNRLDQTGAKEQSIATQSYSPVLVVTTTGTATWKNQGSILAMSPTNYQTDSVNLALNWLGEKGNLTASYYGSFFRDAYNGYSVQSPMAGGTTAGTLGTANGYATNTMSTMPDNQLNQFNLSGGYALRDKTKLTGGFSYGRNTQNNAYLNDPLASDSAGSLNGVVVTKHADLKLIDNSIKNLTLTAGYKFNERDNQTPSTFSQFYYITGNPTAAVLSTLATSTSAALNSGATAVVNTPYSNSKGLLDVGADYRLNKDQNVRVGYERETVRRWCDNVAANPLSGSSTSPAPAANTACVAIESSHEDRLNLGYKVKPSSDLALGMGYTYADRKASAYNSYFYTPYAINGGEILGFVPFFEASRTQEQVKANLNWQATDKFSIGFTARASQEQYKDSPLGDQDGRTKSFNLDLTYSYSDNGVVSGYASYLDRARNALLSNNGSKSLLTTVSGVVVLNTALVAPVNTWNNRQQDVSNTIGINFKQKGLMAGKLDITGDLSLTRDYTAQKVDASSAYYSSLAATAKCDLSNVLTCGAYPDVFNRQVQFKLGGNYKMDKRSAVNVQYLFQKLSSSDYYFNGYQTGYTATAQLPTNEQTPSYSVHAVGVSYIYSFQ